jgi:glycerol-3-phosphate dehydrogenase
VTGVQTCALPIWSDLGRDFGGGLCAAEVEYLQSREWAQTAEDILWRRTKLGLVLSSAQQADLQTYVADLAAAG